MTPRQKRQYFEGLGKTAMAPRKSWLGKSILLNDVQSGWIKSLLTVWGNASAVAQHRRNHAGTPAGT